MEYSKKAVYDENIKEFVKKVVLLCEKEKIPMFMTFALENDSKHTDYVVEMLSAASEGRSLKDDRIVKHALIVNGFEVVPKKTSLMVEDVLETE